jgi:uncharacterized membrane protein
VRKRRAYLLAMGVVILAGYAFIAMFARRLALQGVESRHLFGIGFALNAVALCAIALRVPGAFLWWPLYALGAAANILAFTVLNEGSRGKSRRARTRRSIS